MISLVSTVFIHLFFLNSIKFLFLFKTDIPDAKYRYFFNGKNLLFFFMNILDFNL